MVKATIKDYLTVDMPLFERKQTVTDEPKARKSQAYIKSTGVASPQGECTGTIYLEEPGSTNGRLCA
jgi:hypothetical protein